MHACSSPCIGRSRRSKSRPKPGLNPNPNPNPNSNDVICVHSLCVDALWISLWKYIPPNTHPNTHPNPNPNPNPDLELPAPLDRGAAIPPPGNEHEGNISVLLRCGVQVSTRSMPLGESNEGSGTHWESELGRKRGKYLRCSQGRWLHLAWYQGIPSCGAASYT